MVFCATPCLPLPLHVIACVSFACADVCANVSGEWWVELLRFYSAKDLRELAKTCGQPVHLPPDFQLSYELLRGIQHEHWPMKQLQGEGWLSAIWTPVLLLVLLLVGLVARCWTHVQGPGMLGCTSSPGSRRTFRV